ncbi:hypothetical protein [Dictyobacter aurantiacus]|uniref:Uncharacterized protein n=1 Tax=Dictyobacter aurantiacus TaxID=1936993 RepID=A0A401ZLW9_9CHLR|nr:hypothetical protein [Dictyobacter aurantiacus]GCE07877.1 hypothetical protein KDAU_52060 [Dictyobacter aurantiacus]
MYNYPVLAFSLEAIVLLGGLWLYLRVTRATTFWGKYGMTFFAAFLLLMNAFTYGGPNPPNVHADPSALLAIGFHFLYPSCREGIPITVSALAEP